MTLPSLRAEAVVGRRRRHPSESCAGPPRSLCASVFTCILYVSLCSCSCLSLSFRVSYVILHAFFSRVSVSSHVSVLLSVFIFMCAIVRQCVFCLSLPLFSSPPLPCPFLPSFGPSLHPACPSVCLSLAACRCHRLSRGPSHCLSRSPSLSYVPRRTPIFLSPLLLGLSFLSVPRSLYSLKARRGKHIPTILVSRRRRHFCYLYFFTSNKHHTTTPRAITNPNPLTHTLRMLWHLSTLAEMPPPRWYKNGA